MLQNRRSSLPSIWRSDIDNSLKDVQRTFLVLEKSDRRTKNGDKGKRICFVCNKCLKQKRLSKCNIEVTEAILLRERTIKIQQESTLYDSDLDDNANERCWESGNEPSKINWKGSLFSALRQVALVVVVLAYTCCGALVFQTLEKPHEMKLRQQAEQLRNILAQQLFAYSCDICYSSNPTNMSGNKSDAKYTLSFFEEEMYEAFLQGVRLQQPVIWTFSGSFLFAATVITTIGYGHIAPMTDGGRMFCIAYALIGIPLQLLAISRVTKVLTAKMKAINDVVVQLNAPPLTKEELRKHQVPLYVILFVFTIFIAVGALVLSPMQGWDMLEGIYFCFITTSTIGFGDFVPQTNEYLVVTYIYIYIGLIITTMCFSLVGKAFVLKITTCQGIGNFCQRRKTNTPARIDNECEEGDLGIVLNKGCVEKHMSEKNNTISVDIT